MFSSILVLHILFSFLPPQVECWYAKGGHDVERFCRSVDLEMNMFCYWAPQESVRNELNCYPLAHLPPKLLERKN